MRFAIYLLSFYQQDGLKKNIKTMQAKDSINLYLSDNQ